MNAIIDPASIHSLFLSIQNVKKKAIVSIPTDDGNKAEIKYKHGFNGIQTALFVNDILLMTSEEATWAHAESFVHLVVLSHARPERILIAGT